MPCPAVFVVIHSFLFYGPSLSCFGALSLTESHSCLFLLFSTTCCASCASTPLAHNISLSLITSSLFFNVNTSLKISLIMSSSTRPLMNCSVSNLSYSLYHINIFVCNLPIDSGADSCLVLGNFWYRRDMTTLLCHSLNCCLVLRRNLLLLYIFLFLHVFISCRPSCLSQYLITGTFSSSIS